MEYEDRIICFLDILAFREHVSQSVQPDGSDSPEKIGQLVGALSAIRKNVSYDHLGPPLTQVTQFSDSIAISFPTREESGVFHALVSILWVQIELVLMGILCRGAVTRGKLIHTSELLFGPAMVNAYFLESKAALYPRVILDESIIEAGMRAHARHHEPDDEQRSIMSLLKKDTDGMYYINYITAAQSELDDP